MWGCLWVICALGSIYGAVICICCCVCAAWGDVRLFVCELRVCCVSCVCPVCLLGSSDEITLEQVRPLIQYDKIQVQRWRPRDKSARSGKKASKLLETVVRHGTYRRDKLSCAWFWDFGLLDGETLNVCCLRPRHIKSFDTEKQLITCKFTHETHTI